MPSSRIRFGLAAAASAGLGVLAAWLAPASAGQGRDRGPRQDDALQVLAQGDGPGYGVHGVVFRGRRYDTGDKLDYIKAVVRLACEREDLGPDLREWLRDNVDELTSAPSGS